MPSFTPVTPGTKSLTAVTPASGGSGTYGAGTYGVAVYGGSGSPLSAKIAGTLTLTASP